MKLSFEPAPTVAPESPTRFPQGYWYAQTDDGRNDGIGATPLDALASLVAQIEKDRAL